MTRQFSLACPAATRTSVHASAHARGYLQFEKSDNKTLGFRTRVWLVAPSPRDMVSEVGSVPEERRSE